MKKSLWLRPTILIACANLLICAVGEIGRASHQAWSNHWGFTIWWIACLPLIVEFDRVRHGRPRWFWVATYLSLITSMVTLFYAAVVIGGRAKHPLWSVGFSFYFAYFLLHMYELHRLRLQA